MILAALLSLILTRPIDAIVILVLLVLNATISFLQEWKAEEALLSLKKLTGQNVLVIRSGQKEEIPSSQIVRGDLVVLREGKRVPADLRMISKGHLLVNQASLTGESQPVEKTSQSSKEPIEEIANRHNLLYQGTMIVEGEGLGVVFATGKETQFTQIAKGLVGAEVATPLEQKIKKLGRQILIGVLGLCLIILTLSLKRGETLLESFLILIALIVAAIPEGLPAILTIILALGVYRMAKKKALISRFLTLESLNSSEIILVDKTETLTLEREFLKEAEELGLKVKILTRAHPATALTLAQSLAIDNPQRKLIEGKELIKASPEKLARKVGTKEIFTGIAPHTKLQLVQAFQALGKTVAVTGEGVNDAAALKKADLGITLSKTGTEVTEQGNDLILLNDNLAPIIAAIEEGRTIFRNIRGVVFYFLATNLAIILVILTALLMRLPVPFSPIQILWINLITNWTAGLALAFEKSHGLKKENPLFFQTLFGKFLWRKIFIIAAVITLGVIFIYCNSLKNLPLEVARSSAFISFIFFQILNVFNARSLRKSLFQINPFSNPYLWGSVLLSLGLSLLTIYFVPLQKIFGFVFLPPVYPFQAFVIALAVIVVMEIDKIVERNSSTKLTIND